MEKKSINFKILFLSFVLFFVVFEIFINFDRISNNTFVWFDYFDQPHTPYYNLFRGMLTFLVLTILIILSKNKLYIKMWLYKAFVTLLLMMVYEAFYLLDAYVYFGRAVLYQDLTWHSQHGTMFIVYFNHILSYLVGDSYYAMKIVSSFIGFLGLIFLYKSYEYIMLKSGLKVEDRFAYIFFLLPSIIFWSSILGKDPLNLFFVGMFVYGFIHIIDDFKFRYLIMIILSAWLVSYIRSWYSIIIVTSIFFYYLKVNSTRSFLTFLVVFPTFAILAQQFLHTQGINSIDTLFLKMTQTTQNLAYGKSSVATNTITGFKDYILYFIPNLFTTLFRPMPWDIRNPFTLMAAVENVILLYLSYKYIFKNWKKIYSNKYLKFLILFIFSWSLLYVIISPANLGGAARFKLQVLPVMIMLIGAAMAMSSKKEEKLELVKKDE